MESKRTGLNNMLANITKMSRPNKPNGANKATLASKLKQRSKSKQNKIKKLARVLAKQLTNKNRIANAIDGD